MYQSEMNPVNLLAQPQPFQLQVQGSISPVKSTISNIQLKNLSELPWPKQQYSQESLSASTNDSDNDSLHNTPIKPYCSNILSQIQSQSCQQQLQVQDPSCQMPQEIFQQQNKKKQEQLNYKTEICRNWRQNGFCQYGKKCKYAHGGHELNNKSNVSEFYKTRECKLFHQEGYCSYGIRCHFIHVNKDLKDILRESKLTFESTLQHGIIPKNAKSRFSFVEENSEDKEIETSFDEFKKKMQQKNQIQLQKQVVEEQQPVLFQQKQQAQFPTTFADQTPQLPFFA